MSRIELAELFSFTGGGRAFPAYGGFLARDHVAVAVMGAMQHRERLD